MSVYKKAHINRFPTLTEASKALAEYIVDLCRNEINQKGYFTFVLSGGSTPKLLYDMLGAPPYRDQIQWDKTYFFFGDERFVPSDIMNTAPIRC